MQRIDYLEWRLKRLENILGKSDNKKVLEIINDLNEQVLQYAINSNAARQLLKKSDEINRLTSSNFQRYLMGDRIAKRDLILADEKRIRDITKNLSEIDALANVLDGKYFQEIPKLFEQLNKLSIPHNKTKNEHNEFTQELSVFLQDYAAFTIMMDEKLEQYKTILNRSQSIE